MADYKDTINLPKTDFPMRANLANREPEVLEHWNKIGLYKRLREVGQGRKKYILHDGPPYANGVIHIGHAVNKVLKDIIVKSRTLSGLDVPYVPGWDCHGLPIELEVEKKIGKAGHKVSVEEFRKACRIYAQKQVDAQREEFVRLGVVGDWGRPYLTMEPRFEANIIRALGRVIQNGHLYRGAMPVHWCSACRSALAEAEVDYEDKTSPAIDVRFRLVDTGAGEACFGQDSPDEQAISVVIWTTTPWTLPANQAVALHPELDYVLLEIRREGAPPERVILAEAMQEACLARWQVVDNQVLGRCRGAELEHLRLAHPFYDREVPIILGDHVTTEAGTGAVHTAPGHGQEDYIVGRRYDLTVDNPVGPDGAFLPDTPLFGGIPVFKANADVIKVLQERDGLVHQQSYQHSYPHCWRHKTPIIFRATAQWFVSMDRKGLRKQALDEIGQVRWLPDWGQARIEGMLENRPDWCVSRQRSWGTPIAVFVDRTSGELHPDTQQLIEELALLVERKGIEAWFELDPRDVLGDEADQYQKVTDILDVWFDSGVTHACVLDRRTELGVPADLYLEGSDQHRGWFQSSLLTSVAMNGHAPYRTVLTHGFAVDAQGKKMSKSKGNVVAPQKVIKTLGADILRLWVAATDYRAEMNISDEILKRVADSYRRTRNTARYLLGNLDGFGPDDLLDYDQMVSLDRWAVHQAYDLQQQIIQAYEEFNFHLIYQKLHQFCVIEMGGFYLDVLKDRLYTMPSQSTGRRSAQTAMAHILEALVRWLAPILSFTAEEIWRYMPGSRGESVLLETWYQAWPEQVSAGPDYVEANRFWSDLIAVRQEVNRELERLRNADRIGSGLDAEVTIYCNGQYKEKLAKLEDELRFVLITSGATVQDQAQRPEGVVSTELDKLWLQIDASAHKKCVRCWHKRDDVGSRSEHPDLCGRCVGNIDGPGETRSWA